MVPLRDLLAERSVFLTDVGQNRRDELRSRTPEGVERVSETITIPGYKATAKLTIYRAKKPSTAAASSAPEVS